MTLCGTPKEYCSGSIKPASKMLTGVKAHGSPSQAFICYRRYLESIEGYRRIGSRELVKDDDGPILVLTKKIRYGMRLRKGKEGRWMQPVKSLNGFRGFAVKH